MKVIVAGSRTINDNDEVFEAIEDSGFEVTEIVSGCAQGVDLCGERWAYANEIPVRKFPADWNSHGRAAGPIRNAEMAAYADALVLVWDGVSRGSSNMKSNAVKKGLKIHERIV